MSGSYLLVIGSVIVLIGLYEFGYAMVLASVGHFTTGAIMSTIGLLFIQAGRGMPI